MLISVVVPTFQRNDLLARVLASLAPGVQSVDSALYEVVVTDDGRSSTAHSLVSQSYPWARWVEGPRRGPAANRNNGARHARGDWLAFIDDDCIASPGWLKGVLELVQKSDVDVIEGKTTIPDDVDNPFLYGVQNHGGGAFWTCNLVMKRTAFDAVGGLDEDFEEAAVEDMDFGWRLQKSGAHVVFSPEVLVMHPLRRLSWKGVVRSGLVMRWGLLFKLKKGEALPLDTDPKRVVAKVARDHVMNMVRGTWGLVRRPDPKRWKTNVFFQGWHWMTAPALIPYLCYWELRFRKELTKKDGRWVLRNNRA
jgi:GT2 family glycosyltransferase